MRIGFGRLSLAIAVLAWLGIELISPPPVSAAEKPVATPAKIPRQTSEKTGNETPGATPEKVGTPESAATPRRKLTKEQEEILNKLLLSTDADPDSGPPPLKVKFHVDVYAGDDAVKPQFEWNFGDGSRIVHGQNPTHTYKRPGKYTVVVKAKDATGRVGRDELLPIEVEEPDEQ